MLKSETVTSEEKSILAGCKRGERQARADLYKRYYNYAMSIVLRYSRDREEALEIVNDGFIKAFVNIGKCKEEQMFRGWLRRLMINVAIDYYRKHQKHYQNLDIEYADQVSVDAGIMSALTEQEIMSAVQQLPPSYRYVFNLYVVEGFKHGEIAKKLTISIGTSKSHLAKARKKLKILLQKLYTEHD